VKADESGKKKLSTLTQISGRVCWKMPHGRLDFLEWFYRGQLGWLQVACQIIGIISTIYEIFLHSQQGEHSRDKQLHLWLLSLKLAVSLSLILDLCDHACQSLVNYVLHIWHYMAYAWMRW
jgi:hypothetical protein